MNKTIKFIVISLWVVLTRVYDTYATYQFTPDLSQEANPLVSILGFSWSPLLVTILGLSIWVIYCFFKATFSSHKPIPEETNYNFSNFIGYIYTGEKQKWFSILYKLPSSFNRFNLIMGHLLTRCLVFAGMISTTMWLLLNHTEFYKEIHSPYLIYSILVIGGVVICHHWFSTQFKRYNTCNKNM